MSQERRRSIRYELKQLVQLGFGREIFINAEGNNISRYGIGCSTDQPIDLYSKMFLMIQLKPDDDASIIKTEGIVVRCDRMADGSFDVGVEFTDLFDSDKRKLDEFVGV